MGGNRIFTLEIDVRYRDIDGRGHVNNAVYFTYFEYGRIRFYNAVLHKNTLAEIPFILVHTSCNFISPITLKDRPLLHLWVKEFGVKSIAKEYRLESSFDETVIYATGESIQVCYDYRKNVSIPVPDEIRGPFSEYLKEKQG
jgi:acyl-CoA thioester hydrolase